MYNLFFYNDGGECEHYGLFAQREAAQAHIAKVQAEYGEDVFLTEQFEIVYAEIQ